MTMPHPQIKSYSRHCFKSIDLLYTYILETKGNFLEYDPQNGGIRGDLSVKPNLFPLGDLSNFQKPINFERPVKISIAKRRFAVFFFY